jgi:methylamine dehydrogenase accessory protein MauD
MDDLLLASAIVLWVLVLVLAALVWALTRQVGVLYRRVAPAGALAVNEQLLVGDVAPRVDVETLDGQALVVGNPGGSGRGVLLFFLDPTCSICKGVLPLVKAVAQDEHWLEVVLASGGGTEQAHRRLIESEALERYPYVVSETLGRSYGVGKLPYAVLIDPLGRIASLGIVNSREHLESLVVAWAQQVGSLQDCPARRDGTRSAFDDGARSEPGPEPEAGPLGPR